jgi:hypothetical protein
MQKITSCPQCSNNRFTVSEVGTWNAEFDENGELNASNCDTEITEITCTKCGYDVHLEILTNEIEINFN